MSVFTEVTQAELALFLKKFNHGDLVDYHGILGGVTNTIYYVKTTQDEYVLTLFEAITRAEIEPYLALTHFLARKGFPAQSVVADRQQRTIQFLKNKPAVLMHYLLGEPVKTPSAQQCYVVGNALARLHALTVDYNEGPSNTRDAKWHEVTANALCDYLDAPMQQFLQEEMHFQRSYNLNSLPSGIIHGDLFRDNVLFVNEVLTGFIDFFYARPGPWLLDLAVTVNDWCLNADGSLHDQHLTALLKGYESQRKLTPAEQTHWFVALRKGALRYWLSRLYDYHFIAHGQSSSDQVLVKEPDEFYRILVSRRLGR